MQHDTVRQRTEPNDEEPAEHHIRILGRDHPKCMPCTGMRLLTSPMVLVVFGLTLLTYYPYVVIAPSDSTLATVCKVVFHILVGLMLTAYVQTALVDAGTVPQWWIDQVEQHRIPYPICHKAQTYKPHRSHYDSVTGRLVLNMDHFCPWVANTVGFHNRKYFVQFVTYAAITCCFSAITMVTVFRSTTFPSSRASRRCSSGDCLGAQTLMLIALIFDSTFGIMLTCFAAFHIQLVLTNQTTIEAHGYGAEVYDMGYRRNWEQVFGAKPLYWFLPLWGDGPVGDGLTWPTNQPPPSRGNQSPVVETVRVVL